MRVVFDGYWWLDGPISNRMILKEQVFAWARDFPADEIIVASPGTANRPEDLPESVQFIRMRMPPNHALFCALALPLLGMRLNSDLLISHNFAPLWRRSVVMIQDLIFMDHPEWFTRLENSYFRLMPMLARRRGVRAIASTKTESKRLEKWLHRTAIPVGLGLDSALLNGNSVPPQSLELSRGFALAVGRLNARKNLEGVIAGALSSGLVSDQHPLLVVGEPSGLPANLARGIGERESGDVVFTGRLTTSELKWCYENATVFIMMSRDEGCGLPLMEAAHFGVPVVASNIEVFRELLGDAARYADPNDVEAIGQAIRLQLEEPIVPELSVDYTWQRSVGLIREVGISID